jgi:hypothetical protein
MGRRRQGRHNLGREREPGAGPPAEAHNREAQAPRAAVGGEGGERVKGDGTRAITHITHTHGPQRTTPGPYWGIGVNFSK